MNSKKHCLKKKHEETFKSEPYSSALLQAVNTQFVNIEDEPLYSVAPLLDPWYKDR